MIFFDGVWGPLNQIKLDYSAAYLASTHSGGFVYIYIYIYIYMA